MTIPGWDRHGLERLVRYCARPPLSQERLGRVDDQMLVYSRSRHPRYCRRSRRHSWKWICRPGEADDRVIDDDQAVGTDGWPDMDQTADDGGATWE